MKKIVIACTVVFASAAMLFVSCEAKSCKCTYNDGDNKISTTLDEKALNMLRTLSPNAKLTTCLDLQNFYRENAKELGVSAEDARTVTCR